MLPDREIDIGPVPGYEIPTISEFTKMIIRRWRFVLAFSASCAFLAAIIVLFVPNKYTATTTSLPAAGDSRTGGFMSLMENTPGLEMLGLNSDKNSTSLLYPEILKSRMLADDVLHNEFVYRDDDELVRTDLFGYFDIQNPDLAYRALSKITSINYNKKTGIVELSVTTKYPELSAEIANFYMERLDEFNKHKRKSSSMLKKQFIELRIAENKTELETAEESLKDFRENNRHYPATTDPLILMEHQRLLRDVEVKTQVFKMLAEEYEMAAIQEKKEMPIIQRLDIARPPSVKSGPGRAKTTVLAFMAGIFFASLLLLLERRYAPDTGYDKLGRIAGRIRFISKSRGEHKVEFEKRH